MGPSLGLLMGHTWGPGPPTPPARLLAGGRGGAPYEPHHENTSTKYKANKKIYQNCREAKKSDLPQLKKICLQDTSNSRFFNDLSLPLKFRKTYRAEWIVNFFKKKRGDICIVAYKNKKILGFILMLKKSFGLQIDLIVSSKSHRNKKVGTSLINYVNNNYLKINIFKLLLQG